MKCARRRDLETYHSLLPDGTCAFVKLGWKVGINNAFREDILKFIYYAKYGWFAWLCFQTSTSVSVSVVKFIKKFVKADYELQITNIHSK